MSTKEILRAGLALLRVAVKGEGTMFRDRNDPGARVASWRSRAEAAEQELGISEQTRRAHHVVMDSQQAEIVKLRARAEATEADYRNVVARYDRDVAALEAERNDLIREFAEFKSEMREYRSKKLAERDELRSEADRLQRNWDTEMAYTLKLEAERNELKDEVFGWIDKYTKLDERYRAAKGRVTELKEAWGDALQLVTQIQAALSGQAPVVRDAPAEAQKAVELRNPCPIHMGEESDPGCPFGCVNGYIPGKKGD